MKTNQSYWDIYLTDIMPHLQHIDVLLKTNEHISPREAADALCISLCELHRIMKMCRITDITRHTFPVIMQNGSSTICRLFARELRLGCSDTYLPAQLAYIYNIDRASVDKAFTSLGITAAKSSALSDVFKRIKVCAS